MVAGIVLTTLLVPQGMAYAQLAGLPAITGLYTTILCLVGYALFGPSRLLVLGPDSSLGPMIAATLLPILGSNGSPARAIALASMLALLVGAVMIAAGVAKLGFVADLLSKPSATSSSDRSTRRTSSRRSTRPWTRSASKPERTGSGHADRRRRRVRRCPRLPRPR